MSLRVSSASSTKPESSGTGVVWAGGVLPVLSFPVSGLFVGNEGWIWENFPKLFIALPPVLADHSFQATMIDRWVVGDAENHGQGFFWGGVEFSLLVYEPIEFGLRKTPSLLRVRSQIGNNNC